VSAVRDSRAGTIWDSRIYLFSPKSYKTTLHGHLYYNWQREKNKSEVIHFYFDRVNQLYRAERRYNILKVKKVMHILQFAFTPKCHPNSHRTKSVPALNGS